MTKKTILILTIAAIIVAGTLTTGTVFAKEKPNGQPFNAIWTAIGNLQSQIDEIGTGEQGPKGDQGPAGPNLLYTVTERETAQPGERFDVLATCDPEDALIQGWAIYNTFPAGFGAGISDAVAQNPGNVDEVNIIGKSLNLNNGDGNIPVDGEITILCTKIP